MKMGRLKKDGTPWKVHTGRNSGDKGKLRMGFPRGAPEASKAAWSASGLNRCDETRRYSGSGHCKSEYLAGRQGIGFSGRHSIAGEEVSAICKAV